MDAPAQHLEEPVRARASPAERARRSAKIELRPRDERRPSSRMSPQVATSDLKTQSDDVPASCEAVVREDGSIDEASLAQCQVDAAGAFVDAAKPPEVEEHSY